MLILLKISVAGEMYFGNYQVLIANSLYIEYRCGIVDVGGDE